DNKFVSLGTSLSHVFGANQIAIALDYYGLNGAFSGITPYDIPNRMRLGNSMSAEHIVHEWGHAIDRKDQFGHSDDLAAETIQSYTEIPSQAAISINSTLIPSTITGATTGCSPVPTTEEFEIPFGVRRRIISGYPTGSLSYERCLIGYGDIANSAIDPREDWSDMFMNWVYDRRSDGGNVGFSKLSNLASSNSPQVFYSLEIFAQARRNWMKVTFLCCTSSI